MDLKDCFEIGFFCVLFIKEGKGKRKKKFREDEELFFFLSKNKIKKFLNWFNVLLSSLGKFRFYFCFVEGEKLFKKCFCFLKIDVLNMYYF